MGRPENAAGLRVDEPAYRRVVVRDVEDRRLDPGDVLLARDRGDELRIARVPREIQRDAADLLGSSAAASGGRSCVPVAPARNAPSGVTTMTSARKANPPAATGGRERSTRSGPPSSPRPRASSPSARPRVCTSLTVAIFRGPPSHSTTFAEEGLALRGDSREGVRRARGRGCGGWRGPRGAPRAKRAAAARAVRSDLGLIVPPCAGAYIEVACAPCRLAPTPFCSARARASSFVRERVKPSARLAAARAFRPRSRALIRFHEALLFLRAYPHNERVRAAPNVLWELLRHVRRLERAGEDLSPFDAPGVAGIAGTTIGTDFSFDAARFLARGSTDGAARLGRGVATDRMRATWPRSCRCSKRRRSPTPTWPTSRGSPRPRPRRDDPRGCWGVTPAPSPQDDRAERFDSLRFRSRGTSATRRPRVRGCACPAPGPFSTTRRFSRAGTFLSTPSSRRLRSSCVASRAARGRSSAIGCARRPPPDIGSSTRSPTQTRPRWSRRAREGSRALPRRRGPRAASPAALGLRRFRRQERRPIGYIEGLASADRLEIGFNMYYTFREGESAWIYAQVLKLHQDALGVTSFSIDPYQLGFENDEALDSGAFWFYRKLGFRPTSAGVRRLLAREEGRIRKNAAYRSSRRTLCAWSRQPHLRCPGGAPGSLGPLPRPSDRPGRKPAPPRFPGERFGVPRAGGGKRREDPAQSAARRCRRANARPSRVSLPCWRRSPISRLEERRAPGRRRRRPRQGCARRDAIPRAPEPAPTPACRADSPGLGAGPLSPRGR